ncbi:MAG TPA: hypothetical protein VGB53_07220 [Rubricoccaceae bacterium]|jgi:hypothetical protein
MSHTIAALHDTPQPTGRQGSAEYVPAHPVASHDLPRDPVLLMEMADTFDVLDSPEMARVLRAQADVHAVGRGPACGLLRGRV